MKIWILPLLLSSCAITPQDCRDVGVAVPDGAPQTGTIVEQNIGTVEQVRAVCQSPFAARFGCTLAVAPGEYVIWTVDDSHILIHENCHALYEADH